MRLAGNRYRLQFDQSDFSSSPALTVVGLDISAASVKVALMELRLNGVRVISQADAFLPQGVDFDNPNGLPALYNSCAQALRMAKEGLNTKPVAIVIGLSGSLVKGVTELTTVERSNPGANLSSKEVDNLLLKNQTAALKRADISLRQENPDLAVNLKLLNSSLISFTIDDRPAANPAGQPAGKIAAGLHNVFIPDSWLAVAQKIATNLNLNLIALAHKPFALARGLTDSDITDALLINVEDDLTDVGLLRSGVLVCSGGFNLGWRTFDRALSRNCDLSQAAIDGLKDDAGDFSFDNLEPNQRPAAERALNHAAYVWLQGLCLVLEDFGAGKLPARVFFAGSGAGLGILHRAARALEKEASLEFVSQPKPEVLVISNLTQAVPEGLGVRGELSLAVLAGLGRLASDILNVVQSPADGVGAEAVN